MPQQYFTINQDAIDEAENGAEALIIAMVRPKNSDIYNVIPRGDADDHNIFFEDDDDCDYEGTMWGIALHDRDADGHLMYEHDDDGLEVSKIKWVHLTFSKGAEQWLRNPIPRRIKVDWRLNSASVV